MVLLNLHITPGDRECRGKIRLLDEALERVKHAYLEAVAQPVTVHIVVEVEDAE